MATLATSITMSGSPPVCPEDHVALSSISTKNETAGDHALFAAMVERHGEALFRIANALLRHPQDAEDAVQNGLLKLYRTGAWKQITNERAFLARTVWRAALDRYNGRGTAETTSFDDPEAPALLQIAGQGPTPEMVAVETEQEARLYALVEALPLDLRAPLMLASIEEMTTREIAVALDLNETTVRTRIHRARAELRRRFEAAESRGGALKERGERR
jgi:RNA polymerase sigma-70 factor (ECF subfamily)